METLSGFTIALLIQSLDTTRQRLMLDNIG